MVLQKANKRLHARLTGTPESYWLEFETNFNDEDVPQGVVVDGVMTCPWCQSEHRVSELADDISARKNSEKESRLMAVMYEDAFENRSVRSPVEHDHTLLNLAQQRAMVLESESIGQFSLIPDEPLPVPNEGKTTTLGMGVMAYGITNWGSFFTPRQKVVHGTLVKILRTQMESISDSLSDKENEAVRILLAFCMSRFVDKNANVCLWNSQAINIEHVMSQNHLNPVWSYVEEIRLEDGPLIGEQCRNISPLLSRGVLQPPRQHLFTFITGVHLMYLWMRTRLISVILTHLTTTLYPMLTFRISSLCG